MTEARLRELLIDALGIRGDPDTVDAVTARVAEQPYDSDAAAFAQRVVEAVKAVLERKVLDADERIARINAMRTAMASMHLLPQSRLSH